jgi:hypothetical protein
MVTEEGFWNSVSITKLTFGLGSSLIILIDSVRSRWITVAYEKKKMKNDNFERMEIYSW